MKTYHSVNIVALCFICLFCSCELFASWADPSAGFTYSYDAKSSMLPNNSEISPQWSREYWTDTETYLADSSSGGERALFMDATSTASPMKYGNFKLSTSGGDGTKDDLITLDMRIRLADVAQGDAQPQFFFSICRPTEVSGQSQMYMFNFRKNGIYSYDNQTQAVNIGTDWHNYRIIVDCAKRTSWLYIDGSNTPLILSSTVIQTSTYNHILFGDGSGGIQGKSELAYLKWTNNEAAFPLYQYSYAASCESLPNSNAVKPQWSREYWTDTETYLVDSSSGGERVLFMDATSTASPMKYGNFKLNTLGGDGTKDDLITLDMRIRLADVAQWDTQPQFFFSICRPTEVSGQKQMYMFNFRKNGIYSYDNQTQAINIGTDWHNYRIIVDCAKQTSWLYIDGSNTPFILSSPVIQASTYNHILFGDGSGGIQGKTELAYLKWTNIKADFPGVYEKRTFWDHMWDADQLPELFQDGNVFSVDNYEPEGSFIIRGIDDISTTNNEYFSKTTGSSLINSNNPFKTKDGVFDPNAPSTIEFRINNNSTLETYTNSLMIRSENIGLLGFKFEADNKAWPMENNNTSLVPYVDSEGYSIFRVTTSIIEGHLNSATLYYLDNQGEWSSNTIISNFTSDSSMGYDALIFGDIGVAYSGESSLDYFYFTNHGATTEGIPVKMEFSINNVRTIVTPDDPDDDILFPWMIRLKTTSTNSASGYVLWLKYAWGLHVDDEYKTSKWSLDEGETWEEPPTSSDIRPMNCAQLSDGTVMSVECWSTDLNSDTHTVTTLKWDDPVTDTTPDVTTATLTMPFNGGVFTHRSLVKPDPDDDNWLIQTCYGKQSDSKYYIFVIETLDQGETWSYLSTVTQGANHLAIGYTEPKMIRLADGTLLILMRTGVHPAEYSTSIDSGETWSTPALFPYSLRSYDPECILLEDGTLLATIGTRPGIDIFIDRSGTATEWKKIGASMIGGTGFYCSYTSLVKTVKPDLIKMVTAQSDFSEDQYDGDNRLILCDFEINDNPLSYGIEWDGEWNCNELPEEASRTVCDLEEILMQRTSHYDYEIPLSDIERAASAGIYTVTTTNANELVRPYNYRFESGLPSTIEVRFKNDSASTTYTNSLMVIDAGLAYTGFRITEEHVVYTMANTATSVKLYAPDGWSTIRVLTKCKEGKLTGADLYYKNAEGMWIYGLSSNLTVDLERSKDAFHFGDTGLDTGGAWHTDYVYWTNQAATLDAIKSLDSDYWYWTSERPPQ